MQPLFVVEVEKLIKATASKPPVTSSRDLEDRGRRSRSEFSPHGILGGATIGNGVAAMYLPWLARQAPLAPALALVDEATNEKRRPRRAALSFGPRSRRVYGKLAPKLLGCYQPPVQAAAVAASVLPKVEPGPFA
jgi:hypothetical protein